MGLGLGLRTEGAGSVAVVAVYTISGTTITMVTIIYTNSIQLLETGFIKLKRNKSKTNMKNTHYGKKVIHRNKTNKTNNTKTKCPVFSRFIWPRGRAGSLKRCATCAQIQTTRTTE